MQKGKRISDFLALLYICNLNGVDVYISKRALKHFVESRSREMIKRHGYEVSLKSLYFIVDNIENILYRYDVFEKINQRLHYTKHFRSLIKPSIRIVLEYVENHFEIVTMHYKKIKSTTQE